MIDSNKWTGKTTKLDVELLWFRVVAILWPTLTIILAYLITNTIGEASLLIIFLSGFVASSFPAFCISIHCLIK